MMNFFFQRKYTKLSLRKLNVFTGQGTYSLVARTRRRSFRAWNRAKLSPNLPDTPKRYYRMYVLYVCMYVCMYVCIYLLFLYVSNAHTDKLYIIVILRTYVHTLT